MHSASADPYTTHRPLDPSIRQHVCNVVTCGRYGKEQGFVCIEQFGEIAKDQMWYKIAKHPQAKFDKIGEITRKELDTQVAKANSDALVVRPEVLEAAISARKRVKSAGPPPCVSVPKGTAPAKRARDGD